MSTSPARLHCRFVIGCALAVIMSVFAFAGIRPSFSLEACSWNATEILVLAPTNQAGTFNVVETIKGEVVAGASIDLPALIPSEAGTMKLSELSGLGRPFEGIPPIGKGDRLVVFLRRHGALPEYDFRADLPVDVDGWQPSNRWGDFRTSTIWIQDEKLYTFLQRINPGPTHLSMLLRSEMELRDSIKSTLRLRDAMDRAVGIDNPVERSRELAALFRSENVFARMSALQKLSRGGAAEASVLLDLLSDQSLLGRHQDIIGALVDMHVADNRFTALLEDETAFWSKSSRTLNAGWWNGTQDPDLEETRGHYTRSYALLNAIQKLSLVEAKPVVLEFAAVWATCPPLDEREKSNQITDALASLLQN